MRQHFGAAALVLTVTLGSVFADGAAPLTLTSEQERSIYRSLAGEQAQPALPDFQPELGARLPDIVTLSDLPSGLAADIPPVKDYQFAKLHDQVLLVDPHSKLVREIINPPAASETVGQGSVDR